MQVIVWQQRQQEGANNTLDSIHLCVTWLVGHGRGKGGLQLCTVCCYSAPPFVSALRVHQGREVSVGGVGGGGNINWGIIITRF